MRNRKTHKEYVAEVAIKYPDIKVVGEYKGNKTKIPHKHKTCGNVWHVIPTSILSGHSCPRCFGNIKKSHNEYVAELAIKNPNIEVIGFYANKRKQISHKCKKCGYIHCISPNYILSGYTCQNCIKVESHRQQKLKCDNIIQVNAKLDKRYHNERNKIIKLKQRQSLLFSKINPKLYNDLLDKLKDKYPSLPFNIKTIERYATAEKQCSSSILEVVNNFVVGHKKPTKNRNRIKRSYCLPR